MPAPDKALVLTYAEPGPEISEAKFNEFYDEHAPARLTVPGFLSAARYKATDSKSPSWIAMYDLASPDVIESEAYKVLRANATAHEKSIMSQSPIAHPTVYSLFASLQNHSVTSASLPGKYLLTVGIEPQNAEIEEDQNRWYAEEHLNLVSKAPGFLRARRLKLVSHMEIGGKATGAFQPTKYLTLFEFDRDTFMESQEIKDATATPWSVKIMATVKLEMRAYSLHKTFSQ